MVSKACNGWRRASDSKKLDAEPQAPRPATRRQATQAASIKNTDKKGGAGVHSPLPDPLPKPIATNPNNPRHNNPVANHPSREAPAAMFAKRREASLNPNIDFRRMCGDKSSSKSKSLAEHGEQRTAPLRKNGRHSGQFVCSCLSRHSYCDVFPACACRTRSGNSDGASCCACAQAQLGGPVLLKQGYMQARPSPKSRRQPAIPMDLHW